MWANLVLEKSEPLSRCDVIEAHMIEAQTPFRIWKSRRD
jgi:hypothetical protein